jgi:hypothetical protein
MKHVMMILGMTLAAVQFGLVDAQASNLTALQSNAVKILLPNIVNRITNCVVKPFSIDGRGVKTLHALTSHCPEIKVTGPGEAKIKVDAHIFTAKLVESKNSDGDFYDVTLTDVRSNDQHTISNVLAFGDVLLAVLAGDHSHLYSQQVSVDSKWLDINLLHASY